MRPYTIIFATETLDGKIASRSGFSLLSCYEDFLLQHTLRSSVDAVMVGANTIIRDNPRLTVRYVSGRSPTRVVVDSRLKISPQARVFTLPGRSILITADDVDDSKLEKFAYNNVLIIKVPKVGDLLNLKKALERLRSLGIRKLMVEGGGFLINTLLQQGLVDEIRVTIAPRIFGLGIGLAGSETLSSGVKEINVKLNLKEFKRICGDWIHLIYAVISPKEPLY